MPPPLLDAHPDTVYLTVVDRDLNAVSFINSIYDGFGSGLVCPDTGVLFHSRGRAFRVDPEHPNVVAPGKRPMHTIIPGLAFRGGELWCSFGVMGGNYQPVGQAHLLTRLIDDGLDPQAALDAPRIMPYPGDLAGRGRHRPRRAAGPGPARPPRGRHRVAAGRRAGDRRRPPARRADRRLRPAQGRPGAGLLSAARAREGLTSHRRTGI